MRLKTNVRNIRAFINWLRLIIKYRAFLPGKDNDGIDPSLNWICLTPEPGNYLFGYYDRCPWDPSNSYHLALRIPQQRRLPVPGETATIGYIHRETRIFHPVAETEAWCHQQGAMIQWLKQRPHCFIYNDFEKQGKEWSPLARIYDLTQRKIVGYYDRPVYVLSKDGQWGISLNFARIPRRGYSYARSPLPPDEAQPDLDRDGLFLINMATGDSKLIASYRQFIAEHPLPYDLDGAYYWLNHPSFNSDGSRVMVLFRQSHPYQRGWKTDLYTMKIDGSDLRCVLPDIYWRRGVISHQIWGRTPHEILVDADWRGRGHDYVVFDERQSPIRATKISNGMGPAGHLMFSPDNRWIAADTYPDSNGIQRCSLVNVQTGELHELGRFRHLQAPTISADVRCDLHPRWSDDGTLLTVDTIHGGDRKVYMLDLREFFQEATHGTKSVQT